VHVVALDSVVEGTQDQQVRGDSGTPERVGKQVVSLKGLAAERALVTPDKSCLAADMCQFRQLAGTEPTSTTELSQVVLAARQPLRVQQGIRVWARGPLRDRDLDAANPFTASGVSKSGKI
jgi:hypothetical protein